MMTALCAARNILGAHHDLWAINTEPEYHEEQQQAQQEPAKEPKRPAYAEPPRIDVAGRERVTSAVQDYGIRLRTVSVEEDH